MTDSEMLLLQRGRIPAEVIIREVQSYLSMQEEATDPNELGPTYWLAERANIARDTLGSYLSGERNSVEFDVADRLLIAIGRVDLWRGRLLEYYENVDLTWQTCACPGCSRMVKQDSHDLCRWDGCTKVGKTRGLCNAHELRARREGIIEQFPLVGQKDGVDRIYCSRACRTAAAKLRKGVTQSRRKRYVNTGKVCRNGHPRTPENIKRRPGGKIECAECSREKARERYRASREAVAA